MLKNNEMRTFFIFAILLVSNSCNAQNNRNLKMNIVSFFKINNQDIYKCHKESEEIVKGKTEEWIIKNIYDQCIAHYEYLKSYENNTLKILEKTSYKKDFLIINYISDNLYIPYRTKTILKIDNNYYGIRHYTDDDLIDKDEEFEVSKSDIDNMQKIDEYLKTGKSKYVDDKNTGLIGNNSHWYTIEQSDGKIKMIELFRIR